MYDLMGAMSSQVWNRSLEPETAGAFIWKGKVLELGSWRRHRCCGGIAKLLAVCMRASLLHQAAYFAFQRSSSALTEVQLLLLWYRMRVSSAFLAHQDSLPCAAAGCQGHGERPAGSGCQAACHVSGKAAGSSQAARRSRFFFRSPATQSCRAWHSCGLSGSAAAAGRASAGRHTGLERRCQAKCTLPRLPDV